MTNPEQTAGVANEKSAMSPECEICSLGLQSAHRALDESRPELAVNRFKQLCQISPGSAEAHLGLGRALLHLGRAREAVANLAIAARLEPLLQSAYLEMGRAFSRLEDFRNAAQSYEIYAKLKGRNSASWARCGTELLKSGGAGAAIGFFKKACECDPFDAAVWNNLGLAYRSMGRRQEAVEALQRAVAYKSENASYHYNLSTVSASKDGVAHLQKLQRARPKPSAQWGQAYEYFAKATWLEQQSRYVEAYRNLEKGNAAAAKFAGSGIARKVPNAADWSDAATQQASPLQPEPVFVVGLPRSGTSLMERLIARHTGAIPLGERDWLARSVASDAHDLGARYLGYVPDHARRAAAIIDKMPHNYSNLGAVLSCIPNAHVVHIHRDLRAVGWSIFRHFFTNGAATMAYSFDQNAILQTAERYLRTMKIWEACFPNRIIHVKYERIVTDPEYEMSLVKDGLGLKRDTQASTAAPIRTASALQACQPVYTGSNEAWRHYEAFAADWFAALEQLERRRLALFTRDKGNSEAMTYLPP